MISKTVFLLAIAIGGQSASAFACEPDGKEYDIPVLKEQGQRLRSTADRRGQSAGALADQRKVVQVGCAKNREPVYGYRSTDGHGYITVYLMY